MALSYDGKVVFPQEAILRKNRDQASSAVREFLKEQKAELLVVGLPKGGSSSEEMERRIRHFVALIDTTCRVEFVDEYGSSNEAKQMMVGVTKQKRDGKIDSLSAMIILQRYLGL